MLLRQIFQGITGAGVFKIFQVCGKGAARTFQDGILKKQASKISGFAGQSAKGRKLAGPQFFKPQQQVLAQKRIPGRTFQKFQQFSERKLLQRLAGKETGCSNCLLVAIGVFHYLTVKFVPDFFRKKTGLSARCN